MHLEPICNQKSCNCGRQSPYKKEQQKRWFSALTFLPGVSQGCKPCGREVEQDCKQRSCVENNVKVLESFRSERQSPIVLDECQVTGATDRKKFCCALNESEEESVVE